MEFVHWCEIELFHNLIRRISASKSCETSVDSSDEENSHSLIIKTLQKPIIYKGKVKLHGCNAGITFEGHEIRAQSRNQFIENNSGFGRIVFGKNEGYFKSLIDTSQRNKFTIFGEYCGPKIQKGVALANLKIDVFAVFAIDIGSELIIDPDEIQDFMTKQGAIGIPSNVFILPWHTQEISIDLNEIIEKENGRDPLDNIEELVNEIDRLDPWVKSTFQIEGPGEGLVFYPVNLQEKSNTNYQTLNGKVFGKFAFKAKGEKHRVVAMTKSVQRKPEVASGAEAYANLMCPEPRLEQGAGEIGGYQMTKMKEFIAWVVKDVQKEGKDELEASQLEWKDVASAVTKKAATWYAAKAKSNGESKS